MRRTTQISIPTLVRAKEGAFDRLGLYLKRHQHQKVVVLVSHALAAPLPDRLRQSLAEGIEPLAWIDVADNELEFAARTFADLPAPPWAVLGVGGGKALDVAKYIAFLAQMPLFSVPTSLSNDGFCSPQASLTIRGKRRSFPASIPFGVILDTAICRDAPRILTLSGIGDLVAKFTAVRDWKLAYHAVGEPVNDFAALMSDSSIHAFLSHSRIDLKGISLLATALLMNGIAMEICGSSRPASGSEHLISHALDSLSARPRLHGLQVGVATYLVSILQGENTGLIAELFQAVGFWDEIARDPFSRDEWLAAVQSAPTIKEQFYTILSSRDVTAEVAALLRDDPFLARCFV